MGRARRVRPSRGPARHRAPARRSPLAPGVAARHRPSRTRAARGSDALTLPPATTRDHSPANLCAPISAASLWSMMKTLRFAVFALLVAASVRAEGVFQATIQIALPSAPALVVVEPGVQVV